jgi:hypothetical protein
LDQRKWEAREAAARAAWETLVPRAEAKVDEDTARKLLPELARYEETFKDTQFAWSIRRRRAELKGRLTEIAMALERRLGSFFHGKLSILNARERRVSVVYDFEDPGQLADLKGGYRKFSKGAIRLMKAFGSRRNLWLDAFSPTEVAVRIRYKMHSERHRGLFVWLGMPFTKPGVRPTGVTFRHEHPGMVFTGGGRSNTLKFGSFPGKSDYHKVDGRLPQEGELEVTAQDGRLRALVDGKEVMDVARPEVKLRPGVALGGGYLEYEINHLEVTGRLDEAWVKKALAEPQPTPKK